MVYCFQDETGIANNASFIFVRKTVGYKKYELNNKYIVVFHILCTIKNEAETMAVVHDK